ncbi:MAG: DNA polymerase III subunit delta [bacterium]
MAQIRRKRSSAPAGITPREFHSRASAGTLAPVYVALGGEPLLLDEVLETIRTAVVDETTRDFNLDIVYGEDTTAQALAAAIGALPMMSAKRAVAVKRAGDLPVQARTYLAEYSKKPVDSTVLVLLFDEETSAAWVEKFVEAVVVIDCRSPRGAALRQWAVSCVHSLDAEIDDDALDLLTDSPGVRLIDLAGELEKASLLAGDGGRITLEIMQQVWGVEPEINIWAFMDRIAAGNRLSALRDMGKMRENLSKPKESGLVFSQTIRRWRMALKERIYDRQRVPFDKRTWSGNTKRQWQMAASDLKSLPESVAEKALDRMLTFDRDRKTRSMDVLNAFERLIHTIALDRQRTKK